MHTTTHAAAVCLLVSLAGSCAAFARQSQPAAGGAGIAPPEPAAAPKASIPPELLPYEGRPIHAVIFKTAEPEPAKKPEAKPAAKPGDPPVPPVPPVPTPAPQPPQEIDAATLDLINNQLRLKAGAPFSAELVSDDMKRLNRLGRFGPVESSVQLLADGSVDLIYTVTLRTVIKSVQTVGNKVFSDQELGKLIDILESTPVDPTRLDRACRRIEDKYRDRGYFNALVTVDEKEMRENSIVLFKVREGDKTKVTSVRFEGNVSFTPRELKRSVKTSEAWLLEKGPLDNEILADDVAALITYYRDRGYLDVRCDRVVTPSRDGREAIVTFVIDEGPVYTLRDIKIQFPENSEKVFTLEQVLGLMTLKPGGVYSEFRLKKSIEAVKAAYNKLGYVDANVIRREQRDVNLPLVDLILGISEGRPFRTGQVIIRGDPLTRDDVIRREVQFQPDRPLDSTQIEETQRRLRQTRIFAPGTQKVTIQPENPETPGYRDVLVQVEETNTGSFNIGGAVNSDSGLSAQISLQQRNFDVTDVPDTFGDLVRGESFRGGGQTFTVSASPGATQQIYSISLSDPYLFETDYAGSAAATFFSRRYDGYDETRTAGKFSLGRRFGSRWSATVPVRIENIDLSDIDEDSPVEYFDVGDDKLIAGIGLNLVRTSLDDIAVPSKGNKVEVGIEQVGGDYNFTSIHGEYSVYAKLAEDVLGRKTVLQLSTRAAHILQEDTEVPFFEQYYMGGSNFRGFAFRGVSPVGFDRMGVITDKPVGGTFSFFAGAELRQPLYNELLAGVLFLDTGTVDDDVALDKYRVSVGFGFRLYIQQLSPAPLAFDFGIPLKKEPTDRKRLFTFSVDIPFR